MLHAVRIQLPGHIQPVGGLPDDLILIDYLPESGVAIKQSRYGRQEDLTPVEVAACDRFLRVFCAYEIEGGKP